MGRHSKMYDRQWAKARLIWLANNPLCKCCMDAGQVTSAVVVDHIKPHRGDYDLFWDRSNWQSLCGTCHNSIKQTIEHRGYDHAIGADGWPVDANHPANKKPQFVRKSSKYRRGGGYVKSQKP